MFKLNHLTHNVKSQFTVVENILEKYAYKLPKIYDQKFNERISEIGKLAGINELVIIEQNVSGGYSNSGYYENHRAQNRKKISKIYPGNQ